MKRVLLGLFVVVFVVVASVSLASNAKAAYPEKPIILIVPFPPGGSTDMAARVLASILPNYLGVPVGVENHSGGSGAIGALDVVNAKPDGYTLGVLPIGPVCVVPAILDVGYTPYDLIHIAQFSDKVSILVGRPDAPWEDLREVIKAAKDSPGELTYMVPKTAIYPIMLELQAEADIELQHVPSKGDSDSVVAIIGSEVDLSVLSSIPVAKDHINAGNMKAYAIFADERSEKVPNIPTAKEFGYDISLPLWIGVQAPKGTDEEKIQMLSEAIAKVVNDKVFVKMMNKMEIDIVYLGKEKFSEIVVDHYELFKKWK